MAQHKFIGSHTTTTRPMTANKGDIRFNTTTHHLEGYDGSAWHNIIDTAFENTIRVAVGEEKFGDCHYWVQVTVPGLFSERRQKNLEIHEWVVTTYGPSSEWGYGRWTAADDRYWFKEENDRTWFVLKWTE